MYKLKWLLFVGVCWMFLPVTYAHAQTGACPTAISLVANPTSACLGASPDHNVMELNSPKLTSYRLQYFVEGVDPNTGQPTQTVDVGKPTPNAQNAIWMTRAELGTFPIGQRFVAYAVAVGPAGVSGRSPASNPFGRTSNLPPAAPVRVSVTG